MAAHLLRLSGAYPGDPQDVFTGTSHNQDGHWEQDDPLNRRVVEQMLVGEVADHE